MDKQSLGGMGCAFCSSSTWLPPRKDTVCAGSGQELSQPTSLKPSTTLRGGRSHCFILDTRKPMFRECEEPAAFAQPAHSGPLCPRCPPLGNGVAILHRELTVSLWKPSMSNRKSNSCVLIALERNFSPSFLECCPGTEPPFPPPVGRLVRSQYSWIAFSRTPSWIPSPQLLHFAQPEARSWSYSIL